jgi:hypothetical protein
MEETNHIEQYSPALCFNLPKKSKVGVSLQKFYDEIAVYESEILRYRKNKPQKKQKSNFEDQSKEELMKTAASLQQENIDLRQQSEKLARQVVKLKDSTSNMYQSIEVAKESLPEQIREAKVSQVLLEDR